MSVHEVGAHGAVAWAMSPTTVIEPDSERRVSIRSCMGERSWTSSTTMWPYLRSPSSALPAAGPEQGPGLVDQGGIGRGPGHLLERRRPGPVQQELLLVGQDARGRRRR